MGGCLGGVSRRTRFRDPLLNGTGTTRSGTVFSIQHIKAQSRPMRRPGLCFSVRYVRRVLFCGGSCPDKPLSEKLCRICLQRRRRCAPSESSLHFCGRTLSGLKAKGGNTGEPPRADRCLFCGHVLPAANGQRECKKQVVIQRCLGGPFSRSFFTMASAISFSPPTQSRTKARQFSR